MEKSRWRMYCASRSMASLSVTVPLKAPLEFCWSEDAEREREHRDRGEARITAQAAEAVADVSAKLIEQAEADGVAVSFVLGGGPAEVNAGFSACFPFWEALAN